MARVAIFVAVSGALAYVSRAAIGAPRSHGFSRFLAWETMLLLILLNVRSVDQWFADPLSVRQLASWVLLTTSAVLPILGVVALHRHGALSETRRDDAALYHIERTTRLVTTGVYRYLRHPMYSSLLLLTWGVFLKYPTWIGLGLALLASALLWGTARTEERENVQYFGEDYRRYMVGTARFIPFFF